MNTRASPVDLKKYVKQELKEIINKRPEFKQQLIRRSIYGIYISTTTKYICSQNPDGIEYRLNRIAESSNPIDTSMVWSYTKQGHAYWNDINYEFPCMTDGYMRKK